MKRVNSDIRDSFVREIIQNRFDNGPRLIYADYLEDHGDDNDQIRAAFIRTQIQYPEYFLEHSGNISDIFPYDLQDSKIAKIATGEPKLRRVLGNILWTWSRDCPTRCLLSFAYGFVNSILYWDKPHWTLVAQDANRFPVREVTFVESPFLHKDIKILRGIFDSTGVNVSYVRGN